MPFKITFLHNTAIGGKKLISLMKRMGSRPYFLVPARPETLSNKKRRNFTLFSNIFGSRIQILPPTRCAHMMIIGFYQVLNLQSYTLFFKPPIPINAIYGSYLTFIKIPISRDPVPLVPSASFQHPTSTIPAKTPKMSNFNDPAMTQSKYFLIIGRDDCKKLEPMSVNGWPQCSECFWGFGL